LILQFLGVFAKMRKATVKLRHVCLSLSIRMQQLAYHWVDFHEIVYLNIF